MIKQETTLCYIKDVATQSGTAMAKAVITSFIFGIVCAVLH